MTNLLPQLSELIRERAGLEEVRKGTTVLYKWEEWDFCMKTSNTFIFSNWDRSAILKREDFEVIGNKNIRIEDWLPLLWDEYYLNPNWCIYIETYDWNVFVSQYDFSKDFDSQSEEFHQWLWQQLSNS